MFRTYEGYLKVCDSYTGLYKTIYSDFATLSDWIVKSDTIKVDYVFRTSDFDIYELPGRKILCDNIIFNLNDYRSEILFIGNRQLLNKCAFVFMDCIKLFNFKTQQFEASLENPHYCVKEIITLPDNKIAFVTHNNFKIYDFEACKYIINTKIKKPMSDIEISIKLKLL